MGILGKNRKIKVEEAAQDGSEASEDQTAESGNGVDQSELSGASQEG